MTHHPVFCSSTTPLRLAAQLMSDHDCAAILVTESERVVGIITDRDIACRGVAGASDAAWTAVADCMTNPVIAVMPEDEIEKAISLMEQNSIHHLPVIRADGTLVGMIAQSDIGRRMTNREFGALARMTSIRARHARKTTSALVKHDHYPSSAVGPYMLGSGTSLSRR
ncbi:MAG TPA: CBS domain-containing protein [Thermoanaerobaculia bacterium]|nr:CBS domain-containing protein [Thermoanaerobaculia bacterium]